MKRSNSSFALAVGVSLSLHAAALTVLPQFAGYGVWRESIETAAADEAALPEAEPESVAPPMEEFVMGEATGKGYASNDVPDKVEALAPEADEDQGYLSLDAIGAGDAGQDSAASRAEGEGSKRGQTGGAPAALVAAMTAISPPPARPTFGMTPELKLPRASPKEPPVQLISPAPVPSPVAASTESPAPVEQPPGDPAGPRDLVATALPPPTSAPQPAPIPSHDTGSATVGGAQQPSADPARMSDSEVDPFSKLGTATFRDGKLDIRFGRKVKTRRPKLLVGGHVAMMALQRARVVLDIKIDETGKVIGVEVAKSSGSNEIDQPTRVAVYDWWFEPKADASGSPVPDEVQFTISWR